MILLMAYHRARRHEPEEVLGHCILVAARTEAKARSMMDTWLLEHKQDAADYVIVIRNPGK